MKFTAYLFWVFLCIGVCWTSEEVATLFKLLEIGEESFGIPTHDSILVIGASEKHKRDLISLLTSQENLTRKQSNHENTSSNKSFPSYLPQGVVDLESSVTFYNRPGINAFPFENKSMEIASAFFVSKLIDNVSRIKLLFVSQLSVLQNPKRQSEFNRMLQKISVLLADFTKFFNSIGLVVINDEDNVMLSSYQLVEDVVQKVSGLCEKAPDQYKPFTEKFNRMISTTDENGNYTRVAVINLHEMTSIEADWLKQIVHKELEFHTSNEGDLIIRTSKSSRDLIQSALSFIDEKLTNFMKEVATLIKSRYEKLPNDNFLPVYHELKMLNKILSEIMKSDVMLSSSDSKLSYKKFFNELVTLQDFEIVIPNDLVSHIATCLERNTYLYKISNLQTKSYSHWHLPLRSAAKYIRNIFSHYSCLYNLHTESTTLRIQAQKEGMKDEETFYPTSDLLKQFGISNNSTCVDANVIPDKVKRSVLQYALKDSTTHECVDNATNHLRVFGDLINLVNVNLSYCSSKEIQTLEIFGWNKIFIDTTDREFSVPGLQRLIMISPSIEIQEGSEINLSGRNGEAYQGRALDGNDLDQNGKDGLQGRPGASGGSVLMITGSISSASSSNSKPPLHIITIGGNGGTGQDGGNGGPGQNGIKAQMPTVTDEITEEYGIFFVTDNERNELFLKKIGSPGHRGGKGGNGGPGGSKGLGGEVHVVVILDHKGNSAISNSNKYVRVTSVNGTEGTCGQGGTGGLGGMNGHSLLSRNKWGCKKSTRTCSKSFRDHKWETIANLKEGRAPQGLPGGCGTQVSSNKVIPTSKVSLKSNSIAAYKRISKSKPTNEFQKSVRRPFIELLETADLLNYYTAYGLIDEFNLLNKQIKTQNHNPYSAWKSFAKRLWNLLESLTTGSVTSDSDFKIVAEYLYAASLSKLSILQNNFQQVPSSLVITDVVKYLESFKLELESLRNLRKSQLVQEQRDKYVKKTNESIQEADGAIQQLTHALRTFNTRITNGMDEIITEVFYLHKQAQSNRNQLKEAKKKLSHNLLLQKIFSAINTVGTGLALLGPKGFAVGLVVQGVSSFAHNFLSYKDVSTPSPINLPAGMTSNRLYQIDSYNLDGYSENEIAEFNQTISNIHNELVEFKHFHGVASVITTIVKIKRGIMSSKVSKAQLQNYKDDIDKQIRKSENEFQQPTKPQQSKSSQFKRAFQAIKKCRKLYSFYRRFQNVYKKLKNQAEKLFTAVDSVDDELSNYDSKIQQIEEYQDFLQNKIRQDASQTVENIVQSGVENGKQSLIGLDMRSWNVQTTLRKLKYLLEGVTQGTDSSNELLRCIEMLEDTMRTLVCIYQRQHAFNDQVRLADFIATIEKEETLPIEDPNLRQIVEGIDLSIRSNLIINEFQTILNVVKQWTFPFAKKYVEGLELWNVQPSDNNPSAIIQRISRNILQLQHRISKKESSIVQFIDEIEFSRVTFNADRPFFTWNNEEYATSIRNLLSGNEVAFYADIKKSPENKDAIRFTSVQLMLRAKNASIQKTVDSVLENFRFRMNHLGRSYYRFEDSYFVISNSILTLKYEATNNQNGNFTRDNEVNNVYSKLQNGNCILSPYGMWNITIESHQVGLTVNASIVDLLANNIDIILVGRGSYVQRQPAERNLLQNLDLNRYYDQVQL